MIGRFIESASRSLYPIIVNLIIATRPGRRYLSRLSRLAPSQLSAAEDNQPKLTVGILEALGELATARVSNLSTIPGFLLSGVPAAEGAADHEQRLAQGGILTNRPRTVGTARSHCMS